MTWIALRMARSVSTVCRWSKGLQGETVGTGIVPFVLVDFLKGCYVWSYAGGMSVLPVLGGCARLEGARILPCGAERRWGWGGRNR